MLCNIINDLTRKNMDFSKVKLIVSDLDGTLLNSKHEVSKLFLEQFKILEKFKVAFVAASGRQYEGIASKLPGIINRISIVAENGAYTQHKGEDFSTEGIPAYKADDIVEIAKKIPNSCLILCGKKSAYFEKTSPTLDKKLREYHPSSTIVNTLTTKVVEHYEDTLLKIALYHPESSEKYLYPVFKKHFEEQTNTNYKNWLLKVSGENWLDIANVSTNKGVAINRLQKKLGISPSETMVFGDFKNDLEMLKDASFSYAMQNAHPEVKQTAKFETDSNDAFGVEKIIAKVIDAYQNK